MERFDERLDDELIDLGSATAETKGPGGIGPDDFVGQELAGLTDN